MSYDTSEGSQQVVVDKVVVSIGRSEGINLEGSGVEVDGAASSVPTASCGRRCRGVRDVVDAPQLA